MEDDVIDGVPSQLFGYEIKTRTRIVLGYLLPAFLELNIYNVLMAADIALVVQHFCDGHNGWAMLTLSFILAPAVLCFLTIISSPSQWPQTENDDGDMTMTNTGGTGIASTSTNGVTATTFAVSSSTTPVMERESRLDVDGNEWVETRGNQNNRGQRCCMTCKFLMRQLFNLIIFPIISIYRFVQTFSFTVSVSLLCFRLFVAYCPVIVSSIFELSYLKLITQMTTLTVTAT